MTERPLTPVGGTIGKRKSFTGSDIEDDKGLTEHAFIPVIKQKGTRTRHYFHGYGANDADSNVGRQSFDFQVSDSDGTNVVNAQGTVRAAVYPDDNFDVPKATGDEWTCSELRDLDSNNLRDKELWPTMKPGAAQDEYIVWELQIDSSQSSKVTDAGNCSGLLHYTERPLNRD